jgi:hypothetical protein
MLSHQLESIIQVEIYNSSLYGTYGGWLYVPDSKFQYTTVNVTVNQTYLDYNTTMVRASYYYWNCPSNYDEPQVYYARVVETIYAGDAQMDQIVEGATVTFKRLMNTSLTYEVISTLISDSDGKVNLWLFPSQLYLVSVSKTGYNTIYTDYIPQPANIYGQTDLKTLRITRQVGGGVNGSVYDTLFKNIVYSLEPRGTRHVGGFTIYYNITSLDSRLEWYRIIIYRQQTGSSVWTLLYNHTNFDAAGGSISYTITNVSGRYSVECWYKKSGFDAYEIYNTGSMIYFIVRLRTTMNLIPDDAYFIITIVLMMVAMGLCMLYFSTGVITGYVGLGVMAFMFYMHDVTIDTGAVAGGSVIYLSGWVIFGITFLIYTAALFLWSRL